MPYAIVASHQGDSSVLQRREIDMPTPGAGEVVIRHTAVGLNFIDIYIRTGLYPWPVEKDHILGNEAAGVIEAVGDGVDGFAVGDRVAYVEHSGGGYASHRVIGTAKLVKVPDSIDDKTAAAVMLKGLTAHYLLHRSYPVNQGETVLFHAGAGGVGLIAGQWLAHKGVTAIATAGGAEKCALAAANGYQHVIDYRSQDFVAEVDSITGGAGVAAVYDGVGKDTYPGSLECLTNFGMFVSFGQSSGVPEFVLADLAKHGSLSATRPTLFHFVADRAYLDQAAADLFALVGDGTIKVTINQERPLEEAADAQDQLEARKTTGCTVLIP